ncbi:ROK family protein [Paenibacillus sp. Cedars]|uniref:ROK family protein n=1 Tax=Paenibacillus sp. Cedars TaxID=1980674 RepID=UPI001162C31C|nr:ROK family protein [Paenibacillus sp. Cedars]AWP27463.1 transcriptional regulator [Paenibacillus sp. Cedars]
MKKADANLMKEINLNNVRQAMKLVETATKPQLASLTNLSVVTVNSLVKELQELGELFEDDTVPSNGGRPALTYKYNYDHSLALVIYIKENDGQELISATVVNLRNESLDKKDVILSVFQRKRMYQMIEQLVGLYPSIKVIGIGIPGQAVNGEIMVSSHRELMGVRLIEELETQFKLPVMVENDVNAAIFGYAMNQDLEEDQCMLGIYLPQSYPPGMGIYLNGKIFRGKNGMSGEVKYLPLGLDWAGEMDPKLFIDGICRLIQTVNIVLAPDRVVIYQDIVDPETLQAAWKAFNREHWMPSDPDLIWEQTFQQDFESGLRKLTLQELEPAQNRSASHSPWN